MNALTHQDFGCFFHELWGYDPFPWQSRLAQQVCERGWPACIDLPTASGKTACLDIAVFALAQQASLSAEARTAARRVFFVVNRRVIVDEAHDRAVEMAAKLREAKDGSLLKKVAEVLRAVSGDPDAPPLDVALMRGGIVRDNRWARSITQPTIVASTIDQVGSRLLFRGYGVSNEARPLHAALIAHDSLILLDEAHISQPFVDTLKAVQRYRGQQWAKQPLLTPFAFVQMTATPADTDGEPFRFEQPDHENPVLNARHGAPKPVSLHLAEKAKGTRTHAELAAELAARAVELLDDERRNVAIVVNRIATARKVAQMLPEILKGAKKPESDVHLAIGRMRPIDRDALNGAIQARVGASADGGGESRPMFVVATQCLEVGADFDFDVMVSECASLDALRQRFGRLNRRGRTIDARGAIVIRADQEKDENDPVYGAALSKTWTWLQSVASGKGFTVDFGVNAMRGLLSEAHVNELLAPRLNAPVMFPAYVDAWAQTHPMPTPDPDVALFLHGPDQGEPDVQVCWREDLPPKAETHWAVVVSLCPPSSPECMSVPIGVVRRWLSDRDAADAERSDLLDGRPPQADEPATDVRRTGVLWRGLDSSVLVKSPNDVRPGDTLVLSVSGGGWEVFGHIPEDAPKDIAERAYRSSRGRILVRLRSDRLNGWPTCEAVTALHEWLSNPDSDLRLADVRALMREVARIPPEGEEALAEDLATLGKGTYGCVCQRYPDGVGAVLQTRRNVDTVGPIPALDDGEDSPSRTARREPVRLADHLKDVAGVLKETLKLLPLPSQVEALGAAVAMHDWGKADERFQALLINGDINDAWAQPEIWAKSANMPMTAEERRRGYVRSGLPAGFRHEMLSVQLAEAANGRLPQDPIPRDLALHLIATHHGRGRPFAPVVIDEEPPEVDLAPVGATVRLSAEERKIRPPHRLDSGVAERFWMLTRHYGWWGLAYLEAVVRLADQRASQKEDKTGPSDSQDGEVT